MKPDVELVRVGKAFGGVGAVADVSFAVEPESFFSLLGPSGCGKTTLLKLIAGFIAPDSGDIVIRGERVNERPPYRRDTAMVFQNYALFPHLSVFDNIAFGLRYRKVRPRDQEVQVHSALERVGLGGLDRRYPSQLSGGQQQRVALARAIVLQPALLLLDEPLSNLDLRLRQQMRNELRGIQRDVRITTIFVTHDQAEAFSMSDRIAIMEGGRLLQVGTPDDIYLRPASEFVVTFVGETNRLAGIIVAHEHGDVVLRSEDGLLFRARGSGETESEHPVGSRRLLFFRVEQARLLRAPGTGNSLAASVENVYNFGAMMGYTVRVSNGLLLRAAMATTQADVVRTGEAVFVDIDPSDCILIRHD